MFDTGRRLPSSSMAPTCTPRQALGFDMDYRKLLKYFQKRGYLLRAYYYTAISKIRNIPRSAP